MAVFLSPIGNGQVFLTAAGLPAAFGFINTYQAGTTTPAATFTTNLGNIANAQPIPLTAAGMAPFEIWLTGGQAYKFVITDAALNPIGPPYDNIYGVGDSTIVGGVVSIDTIAALRLTTPKTAPGPSQRIFVAGYYSVGDGGGGWYRFNASDTTNADNGGSIIVAGDGGRWYLNQKEFISSRQFGCKIDGSTDDTAAVNAMLASGFTSYYFNAGAYAIAGTISFGNGSASAYSTQLNGATIVFEGTALHFQAANLDYGVIFRRSGNSAAAVANINGPIFSMRWVGFPMFDGNSVAANNVVNIIALNNSQIDGMVVFNPANSSACLSINTIQALTINGSGQGLGTTVCTFGSLFLYSGSATNSGCLNLDGFQQASGPDVNTCTFNFIQCGVNFNTGQASYGIRLGYCDHNTFNDVVVNGYTGTGSASGASLNLAGVAGGVGVKFPDTNIFNSFVVGAGDVNGVIESSPSTIGPSNLIRSYDLNENGGAGWPTTSTQINVEVISNSTTKNAQRTGPMWSLNPTNLSANYTPIINDKNRRFTLGAGALTITIPANVFAYGDTLEFLNITGGGQTIAQGASLTMTLSNSASTGNRALAQQGWCKVQFGSATTAVIYGIGLT